MVAGVLSLDPCFHTGRDLTRGTVECRGEGRDGIVSLRVLEISICSMMSGRDKGD